MLIARNNQSTGNPEETGQCYDMLVKREMKE
jgi:hypothetical protein